MHNERAETIGKNFKNTVPKLTKGTTVKLLHVNMQENRSKAYSQLREDVDRIREKLRVILQKLDPHSLYPVAEYLDQAKIIPGIQVRSLTASTMREKFLMPGI